MKKNVFGMIAALFAFMLLLPVGARAADNVYAILYDDGTLVFQNSNAPESGKKVTNTYKVDFVSDSVPWYDELKSVRAVNFADKICPTSTASWFDYCSNLEHIDNIQNLDTSNVTTMRRMFIGCSKLTELDVSHFNTSNVTDMKWMFAACSGLTTLDVSHFDTSSVTDMSSMFWGDDQLTALDVSHFDTSNVTSMSYMFSSYSGFTKLDLSHFDTSNVRYMHAMFSYCSGVTELDLSHFDTSNVISMNWMFYGCSNLKTIYASDKFVTSSVVEEGREYAGSQGMFYDCTALVGGNGTKYDSGHTDKEYARIDAASAPGYFTAKDALSPTPATYTITWKNYDGTVLKTDTNIAPGTIPTYGGDAPIRIGHTFTGWFPQPSAVTGNVTYTAQFKEIEQPPETPSFNARRDAYAFGNSMSDFGYTSRGGKGGGQYPIPPDSFFMIFGKGVRAKMLYMQIASAEWAGNCAGMSGSAALLYARKDANPADFGKDNAWSLAIGDKNAAEMSVLTFVEAMQIAQYADAFAKTRQANQILPGQSLNGLYQAVKDEMEKGRPTLIAIVKNGVGGHALLAVGADDAENRILIYDCNYPGELRYMTLSADKTGWSYDMGGHGVWGSNDAACSISYVPYAVLEDIWTNRGNLKQNTQVLTVNAQNLSITNFDGDAVATLKNGQLVTSAEGVYEMSPLSMYWPESRSICLPRNEVYTLSTSDDITLTASMTDLHMSAAITTNANSVTFGVDDDEKSNSVILAGASASDTYSISLESDFADFVNKSVELSGTGQGQDVNVSMTQGGGVTLVNCNITSLSVDSKSKVYGIASASPDNDGNLSVKLTNPGAAKLAVACFDADGRFLSVNLRDVPADVGTATVSVPADAEAARVMLYDENCRPLCKVYRAAVR